jgi:hypothetical protein
MAKMKRGKRTKRWIQKTGIAKHRGALHVALGIPLGEKIPLHILKRASHEDGHVGHMANMALRLRGFKHHK